MVLAVGTRNQVLLRYYLVGNARPGLVFSLPLTHI